MTAIVQLNLRAI